MKKESKSILVPIDFKEPSLQAFRYAYNLAIERNMNVLLLHVIETSGILSDYFSSSNKLVQITDKAKEKLSEIINSVQDKKVPITSRVESGKPYEKILKVAEETNTRMIILGENHQGVDANQELGSTVYHVTLKSPVPVLTLKGNIEKMNHTIVVPLDLTGQMRRQLFSALVYGLNYGAKIHLVSALIGGIKMRDSRIFKKLKLAKKTLIENGIECTIQLFPRTQEPPFRKVISYAKEIDAGLILVMTHKEGYTYDNYIGAFAHHIINQSQVPVLSLTSAATDVDSSNYLASFVDPVGMLLK
ncbi:MAG: universal stress protein [Bacteroidales bacterium]|nr:universal stress protein [Bacteroidales bacterium]